MVNTTTLKGIDAASQTKKPIATKAPAPTRKPQTTAQTQAAAIQADKKATSTSLTKPNVVPDKSGTQVSDILKATTTKKPVLSNIRDAVVTTPRPSEIWDITKKPATTTKKPPATTVTTKKPPATTVTTLKPPPITTKKPDTTQAPVVTVPPSAPSETSPTPPAPPVLRQNRSSSEVISASPDLIIQDDQVIPEEILLKLMFEDIGAQELLLLSRHDVLNGKKIAYQPISNIGDVDIAYGSENILFATESFKNYFKNFTILLESYVPELAEYSGGPNVTVSPTSGAIVLEFKDIRSDQRVEVQIAQSLNLFDDTIY